MGKVADRKVMNKVKLEHDHYGDIVQEDFMDSYRNLTYKGICALKWISTYCKKATFALKTDDDILVNIFKINDHIRHVITKSYGTKDLILCNQWVRMKVLRDKKSKWYIPKDDFGLDYFPPYCSGSAFILSADVIRRMYEASFDTPFFWVDDYYITGALAKKINVVQKRLNDMYMLNGRLAPERFKNDTNFKLAFFHVPKLNTIYRMWTSMKKGMLEKEEDELNKNSNRTKKVR
ncbi:hypothetical protein FSP39_009415 [Pinctada imbricata]|uniref:Hexosyltransferase n=1 Tax=Pinctada imbricata TaxID=66713 RepID=A0AA89C184_PINIB|nr:hypothetical protein FSP39_009415 [Pinctada imbricata]